MIAKPLSIFISYAHKDSAYLQELLTFLKPYIRDRKSIEVWTDRNIVAGQRWDETIKSQLKRSEIILLLISPDFLASDYINETEIKGALSEEQLTIVPILIRPVRMELLQFKHLQVVPTDAKPVASWASRDEAWNNVVAELERVFGKLKNRDAESPGQHPISGAPVHPESKRESNSFIELLVKFLFALLIAISICVFVIGFVQRDSFYFFPSFAGMGGGLAGFFFVSRLRSMRTFSPGLVPVN